MWLDYSGQLRKKRPNLSLDAFQIRRISRYVIPESELIHLHTSGHPFLDIRNLQIEAEATLRIIMDKLGKFSSQNIRNAGQNGQNFIDSTSIPVAIVALNITTELAISRPQQFEKILPPILSMSALNKSQGREIQVWERIFLLLLDTSVCAWGYVANMFVIKG